VRPHPGPFLPAVFQAAIDAGGAVRPLALRYTLSDGAATTLATIVGDDTLFKSVWRVVTTRGLVVEVEIGPALQAYDVSRRALATQSAGMVKQLATAGRRPAEVMESRSEPARRPPTDRGNHGRTRADILSPGCVNRAARPG